MVPLGKIPDRWTGQLGLGMPRPDRRLRAADPGQPRAVVFDRVRDLLLTLQAGLLDPEDRRGQRHDGQPAGAGRAIGANAESIAPVNTTRDEACVIGPVENIQVLGLDLRLDRSGGLSSRLPDRGNLLLGGTANVRASALPVGRPVRRPGRGSSARRSGSPQEIAPTAFPHHGHECKGNRQIDDQRGITYRRAGPGWTERIF